jgi:hypothetical protein
VRDEVVIYNLAGACSLAHQQSALAANAALLGRVTGRLVVRNLPSV